MNKIQLINKLSNEFEPTFNLIIHHNSKVTSWDILDDFSLIIHLSHKHDYSSLYQEIKHQIKLLAIGENEDLTERFIE